MNLETIATSFGIGGLVLAIGYRIAVLLIKNWRETERERTAAIAAGFKGLVDKLDTHVTADLQAHADTAERLAGIEFALGRRATPAHGLRVLRPVTNHDKDK